MKDLVARIRALPPDRLELLNTRLRPRRPVLAPEEPSQPPTPSGDLPLSFAQERLWFIEQLRPGLPIYNLYTPVRFRGPLDLFALQRALDEIVRRHGTLRTTFPVCDGRPVQRIRASQQVLIRLLDLREYPPGAREEEARRLASEEAMKVFDLQESLPFRATLVRLETTDHILVLVQHHIVSDGWSIGVLLRELGQLYTAFNVGPHSALPELPLQYTDLAIRQREAYASGAVNSSLSYWLDHLAGASSVLELPTDRPRPAVQSFRGASQSFGLARDIRDSLQGLARCESATLFMTLLAAFAVLLLRFSGQSEIVIGAPVANRNRAEIEGLIGLFVNTLPLRLRLSGNPPFRAFLHQTREVTLGGYAHQDVPFEKVVENLRPERDLSHNPVFQVMFTLQNQPTMPEVELGPQEANEISPRVTPGTARFDLTLAMSEVETGLIGTFEYNTDLFDSDTILRWAGHLRTLMEAAACNPDTPVWDLPLVSTDQLAGAQVRSATLEVVDNEPVLIHDVLVNCARRTPDGVAVQDGTTQITYSELDWRSSALAQDLIAAGIKPEDRIGISLPRSLDLIVAVFGVLKAGAAYVPMNLEDPARRLESLLKEAQISLILTGGQMQGGMMSEVRIPVLEVSSEGAREPSQAHPESVMSLTAGSLAYVICSSGSTGVPKAIMVPHEGPVRLVRFAQQAFRVGTADRVLQFFSFSFDAWLWDVLLAFSAGATLCIAPDSVRQSAIDLSAYIRDHSITAATLLPSLLAAMDPDPFPGLHTLIVGGEACPADLVDKWGHGRRFYNVYGPTEASVAATAALCKPGEGWPPLGQPLPGTSVYVLDRNLKPAVIGVPGELYIGGIGLARGYLGRPAWTAERFLPDPFGAPGRRMYATGDRARFRIDGTLEFLGRLDDQVKVRGYRIERGEVAAIAKQHPDVKEIEVMLRKDGSGSERLVAYLTLKKPAVHLRAEAVGSIRRFLTERLPNYMIPAALNVLEEFPRTPSGKVDPSRLAPTLDASLAARQPPPGRPRNNVEKEVSKLWREVLQVQEVDVRDDFFELGGHSLAATWLTSRIQQKFGIELPLRCFFQSPTIEAVAAIIIEHGRLPEIPREPPTISELAGSPWEDSEQLLANMHELTDADVNALLGRMQRDLQMEPSISTQAQAATKPRSGSVRYTVDLSDAEGILTNIDQLSDEEVASLLQSLASANQT